MEVCAIFHEKAAQGCQKWMIDRNMTAKIIDWKNILQYQDQQPLQAEKLKRLQPLENGLYACQVFLHNMADSYTHIRTRFC